MRSVRCIRYNHAKKTAPGVLGRVDQPGGVDGGCARGDGRTQRAPAPVVIRDTSCHLPCTGAGGGCGGGLGGGNGDGGDPGDGGSASNRYVAAWSSKR